MIPVHKSFGWLILLVLHTHSPDNGGVTVVDIREVPAKLWAYATKYFNFILGGQAVLKSHKQG